MTENSSPLTTDGAPPGATLLAAGLEHGTARPVAHREYLVHLDMFEGPLDLLLFLIRRAEVEITDIPIAEITKQYLGFLEEQLAGGGGGGSGGVDIEDAGEFLVMAATLMEIKSRMLAPPTGVQAGAGDGESGESPNGGKPIDPRTELVRQLLEYKRYRDATEQLERYRREWESRFPVARIARPRFEAAPDAGNEDAPVELDDVELIDLVEAFARVIETVDFSRVGEHHVRMDETPVEIHAADIVERLRTWARDGGAGEMAFIEVFRGRTRADAIGLFLALLELIKQQRVGVRADEGGAGIVLELREIDGVEATPGADVAPAPA